MRSRAIGGGIDAAAPVAHGAPIRVADEPPTPFGVWSRVALGGVLMIAMTQWPYAVCGFPLFGYSLGVAMILIAGVWAARAAWLAQMGRAHIVALLLAFMGTALAANQILPRIGYASAQLTWGCLR